MGSLIGSGSSFLIYIVVAREIGPKSFGLFSSALATVNIFSLIAGFGVSQSWLKLFGREGWGGTRWIKPSIKFVILTLILITIGLYIWAYLPFQDPVSAKLLIILSFYVYGFISVELVASKLQLEESYNYLALWQSSPNLLRLIVILLGMYFLSAKLNVYGIAIIYASVGLLVLLFAIPHLHRMSKGIFNLKGHGVQNKSSYNKPISVLQVFREAWPFGMANLFAFIYVQSDIIMVKYLSGDEEAGYYNVGYVILTAILVIPTIMFGKFLLPKYHRWSNQDTQKFYMVYKRGNAIMIGTGLLAMVGVLLVSNILIPIIFGQAYEASVPMVNILAFSIPISFLAYSVGATLVTNEHMKLKVILMGLVAVINIVCNLLLIPIYEAKGAAIATVGSNFVLLLFYFWGVKKKVFTTDIKKK